MAYLYLSLNSFSFLLTEIAMIWKKDLACLGCPLRSMPLFRAMIITKVLSLVTGYNQRKFLVTRLEVYTMPTWIYDSRSRITLMFICSFSPPNLCLIAFASNSLPCAFSDNGVTLLYCTSLRL